jgi:hypothetical protein
MAGAVASGALAARAAADRGGPPRWWLIQLRGGRDGPDAAMVQRVFELILTLGYKRVRVQVVSVLASRCMCAWLNSVGN